MKSKIKIALNFFADIFRNDRNVIYSSYMKDQNRLLFFADVLKNYNTI